MGRELGPNRGRELHRGDRGEGGDPSPKSSPSRNVEGITGTYTLYLNLFS